MSRSKREHFKHRIRRLIKQRGWTIRETAARVGLPGHRQIRDWMGGVQPRMEYWPLIATAFGITVEELMDGLLIVPRAGLQAIPLEGATPSPTPSEPEWRELEWDDEL